MTRETEIKIAVTHLPGMLETIVQSGFVIHVPRLFERNLIFDRPDASLRSTGQLLRLRDAGGRATLTYKGIAEKGRHKSREERETEVASFPELQTILERLGYRVTFLYEKFRTEYTLPRNDGVLTVDETPVGNYLELEGEPEWIDRTAALLGFTLADYSTASYARLYQEWCARTGVPPAYMQFTSAEAHRGQEL